MLVASLIGLLLALPASARHVQDDRAAPPIAGLLLDELGVPLPGWSVAAEKNALNVPALQTRGRWTALTETDGSGGFRFDPSPGPGFVLVAWPPSRDALVLREDFELGGEITLRVRPDDRRTAFVEGVVELPAGLELDALRVSSRSSDELELHAAELAGKRFRIGPVRPGAHRIRANVTSPDGVHRARADVVLRPGETRDVGTLAFVTPGRIAIRHDATRVDVDPSQAIVTTIEDAAGAGWGGVANGEAARFPVGRCGLAPPPPPGGFELGISELLAPGRFRLVTRSFTWYAPDVLVDVAAGETASLGLALEPATTVTVRVIVPAVDPSTRARLRVLDERGGVVLDRDCVYRSRDAFVFDVMGVPVGTYRAHARSAAGREGSCELLVRDLRRSYEPVDIDLR